MQSLITPVIALLIILSDFSWSQVYKYKLTGKVFSSADGMTIAGANITVKGTMLGAATDKDGRYTITGIPKGRHEIDVSFIGCYSSKGSIEFDTSTRMQRDFVLESRESQEIICHQNETQARKDIDTRSIHLVMNSGIVGLSLTEKDREFEKKYGVRYDIRGCTDGEPEKCLDEYYRIVLRYLDSRYGMSWRNEANKMWLLYLDKRWK